jgi:copper transport protein
MRLRRGLAPRALLVVFLAAGVVALVAAPASAHAELIQSDPAPGAVLNRAPSSITLSFNEDVEVESGAVRLFDSDGQRVDNGGVDVSGQSVTLPAPDLGNGAYVVTWRVTSADSHPVRGAFTFQVGQGGAGATSRQVQGLANRLLAAQGGDPVVGALAGLARVFVFAGLALLIGGAFFVTVIWPPARTSKAARWVVQGGWIAVFAATLSGLLLYGPYAEALGLGDMFTTTLLGDTLGTRFGKVWLVRLVVLLAIAPLLRLLFPRYPDADAPDTHSPQQGPGAGDPGREPQSTSALLLALRRPRLETLHSRGERRDVLREGVEGIDSPGERRDVLREGVEGIGSPGERRDVLRQEVEGINLALDRVERRLDGLPVREVPLGHAVTVEQPRVSSASAEAPGALPRWWAVGMVVGSVLLALTPGLAGHASTGDWVSAAIVADTIHVLAMAIWLGGLVVLALVTLSRRAPLSARDAVERFSRVALGCIVALVATGAFQTWRQVGSLEALRSTDYGRILVVKLVLVAVVIVFAAFSREVVLRILPPSPSERTGKVPVVAGGSDDDASDDEEIEIDEETELRRLRRSVWAEIATAALILVATALLVNAAPAKTAVASAGGVAGITLHGDGLNVDVTLTPAVAGTNDVHADVSNASGAPKNVQELTVTFALPSRGIAPIDVPLRRLGPGHYYSPGFEVPISGEWRVRAKPLLSEFDEQTLRGSIAVG